MRPFIIFVGGCAKHLLPLKSNRYYRCSSLNLKLKSTGVLLIYNKRLAIKFDLVTESLILEYTYAVTKSSVD